MKLNLVKYYYKLFNKQKYQNIKTSEKLDQQTFSIPLHPGLTKGEIDIVINEIKKITK